MDTVAQQAFEEGLGDARISSIEWTDGDLIIELIPPGTPPLARRMSLRFIFVSKLRINLDYGTYAGLPLVYSARASKLPIDTGWNVLFVFGAAPEGTIEFECNDMRANAQP